MCGLAFLRTGVRLLVSSSYLQQEPNLKTIFIVDQRRGQRSGCRDNPSNATEGALLFYIGRHLLLSSAFFF